MDRAQWIEWIRTTLRPEEGEALLATSTPEQRAHLLEHDYVFVAGVGVIWIPSEGGLRRARFTHGAHFRTRHDEFYIDSVGHVRSFADPDATMQPEAA